MWWEKEKDGKSSVSKFSAICINIHMYSYINTRVAEMDLRNWNSPRVRNSLLKFYMNTHTHTQKSLSLALALLLSFTNLTHTVRAGWRRSFLFYVQTHTTDAKYNNVTTDLSSCSLSVDNLIDVCTNNQNWKHMELIHSRLFAAKKKKGVWACMCVNVWYLRARSVPEREREDFKRCVIAAHM